MDEKKREMVVASMQLPFTCGTFASANDFMNMCWPRIESALFIILTQKPGEFIPLSYEELYSTIYKGVVNFYSPEMFSKLESTINLHLWAKFVHELPYSSPSYLEQFSFLLAQYLQGVNSISAIFHYMDRVYLSRKRNIVLSNFLREMLVDVLQKDGTVFDKLAEAANTAFLASPDTMMQVVTGLYSLNPDFAKRNLDLFSRFIPNICPRSSEADIPLLAEENRRMQDELIIVHGFERTSREGKRSAEMISESEESSRVKRSYDEED